MYPQSNQSGIIRDNLSGNIINANLLGYTTVFGNQTPVDVVAYSLLQQGQYPQGVGEVGTVDYGKDHDNTKTQTDIEFEERLRRLLGIINPIGTGLEAANEILKKEEEKTVIPACDGYSNDNWLGIPFRSICESTVDYSKRLGLVVIAILLLALGIWKLK